MCKIHSHKGYVHLKVACSLHILAGLTLVLDQVTGLWVVQICTGTSVREVDPSASTCRLTSVRSDSLLLRPPSLVFHVRRSFYTCSTVAIDSISMLLFSSHVHGLRHSVLQLSVSYSQSFLLCLLTSSGYLWSFGQNWCVDRQTKGRTAGLLPTACKETLMSL